MVALALLGITELLMLEVAEVVKRYQQEILVAAQVAEVRVLVVAVVVALQVQQILVEAEAEAETTVGTQLVLRVVLV
jgi:hypothetical protein